MIAWAPLRVPPTDPAKFRPKSRRPYHDAIPWVVYLGANTSARLAMVWDISEERARNILEGAYRRGEIKRRREGRPRVGGRRYVYFCPKPADR